MTTIADAPPLVAEAVGIHARDYQREGIDFLWSRRRAMLTDAPGLGKTPQGALAAEVPAIVVAPNYLVGQWGDWLEEHLPARRTVVAQGDRFKKIDAIRAFASPTPPDFLVVNKEMLRTHGDELRAHARYFKTLIIDEAHHMRNRGTEQAKGAVELAQRIERVYLLTATPIWKEVDDLFMQFRILQPAMFKSYAAFVNTWCVADQTRFGTQVIGVKKEMRQELSELLDIMRLGRNYKDVGRQVPEAIANVVHLEFPDSMRAMYEEAVNNYRVQFAGENGETLMLTSNSAVMHTLRQFTAWPGKVEAVLALIEEAAAYSERRTVVFTWYRDVAYTIAKELNAAGRPAVAITGAITDPNERRRLANGKDIVVCNIAALSEGVDLSWARHVIFAEEHWPPGSATQSLARIVRERQTASGSAEDIAAANAEPVLVHYVLVRGTIDDVIHRVSRRRAATIKDVLRETLDLA